MKPLSKSSKVKLIRPDAVLELESGDRIQAEIDHDGVFHGTRTMRHYWKVGDGIAYMPEDVLKD